MNVYIRDVLWEKGSSPLDVLLEVGGKLCVECFVGSGREVVFRMLLQVGEDLCVGCCC